MKIGTWDRGEIIHWAGSHDISPALREDGSPALAGGPDPALRRCGWQAFFSALDSGGLALVYDRDDPGAGALVPRAEAPGPAPAAGGDSRRFLRALLSARAPGPAGPQG